MLHVGGIQAPGPAFPLPTDLFKLLFRRAHVQLISPNAEGGLGKPHEARQSTNILLNILCTSSILLLPTAQLNCPMGPNG